MKKHIFLFLALLVVSACQTTVKGDGYSVKVKENNGDFCPPGQAKKGNC